MKMMMTMMNFIIWKKILYFNIYLHYLQKYNLFELKENFKKLLYIINIAADTVSFTDQILKSVSLIEYDKQSTRLYTDFWIQKSRFLSRLFSKTLIYFSRLKVIK